MNTKEDVASLHSKIHELELELERMKSENKMLARENKDLKENLRMHVESFKQNDEHVKSLKELAEQVSGC